MFSLRQRRNAIGNVVLLLAAASTACRATVIPSDAASPASPSVLDPGVQFAIDDTECPEHPVSHTPCCHGAAHREARTPWAATCIKDEGTPKVPDTGTGCTMTCMRDDTLHGPQVVWRNGAMEILSESQFRLGERHGFLTNYYEGGSLAQRSKFVAGQQHGVDEEWHLNGQLARRTHWESGVVSGVGEQWDEAGKLLGRFELRQGVGVSKSWFEHGGLRSATIGSAFRRYHMWGWRVDGSLHTEHVDVCEGVTLVREWSEAGALDSWRVLCRAGSTCPDVLPKERWGEAGDPLRPAHDGSLAPEAAPDRPHIASTMDSEIHEAISRCETEEDCRLPAIDLGAYPGVADLCPE